MESRTGTSPELASEGHGNPPPGGVTAGAPWDSIPPPAEVRAALVHVLADSGSQGMADRDVERAVAVALPELEDPIDADIDSLVLLGVLERVAEDRLIVTELAASYLLGLKVSA